MISASGWNAEESEIVSVALDGDPIDEPVALDNVRFTVSSPSAAESMRTGTMNVLAAASPPAQFRVPDVVV